MINKQLGQWGESKSQQFLIKKGLTYVTKNYRCRLGEIDLIFSQKDTLIIVEVKTASTQQFGESIEKVTPHKQQKIIQATLCFIQQHPKWENHNCRFDVIGIDQNIIQWIPNAFEMNP